MTIADTGAETGSSRPSDQYPRYLRGTFQKYQVVGTAKVEGIENETVSAYPYPLRYHREYGPSYSDDTVDPMDETGSSVPLTYLVLNKLKKIAPRIQRVQITLFLASPSAWGTVHAAGQLKKSNFGFTIRTFLHRRRTYPYRLCQMAITFYPAAWWSIPLGGITRV